jgi:adenine-specific DNA-methyltransferase
VPATDRQETVLNILRNLRDLDGLKRLFWEELNYERENRPLSPRQWPESARQPLAEDPILFATGGEDNAFHVVYCRLESDALLRGHERPVVNRLTREHPYALFVFSNKGRTAWHFLNVKYDDEADKRRLLRRITVRPGEGLRTAAERMQMLDLETISPDLFALSPLTIQQRHDDAFDVEKVSKDFYREIANWYFWALKHVTFPKDAPKEQDGRDHISVIRLITRLIFCWFIREKGLIPDVLFDEPRLAEMLGGFAPGKKRDKESVFYRAILQNLFFATLNTEMDQRGWRRPGQNLMAHILYRHKECFRDPKAGLEWFKDIPFLNGGLFECLDRDKGEGVKDRYVRVDGFSDRDDSRPTVPDFLFFGSEQDVDLSDDYGDKKFRSVRVRGLIDTLSRYKFTIEENTPFDQEVALDPELCGKVFENLLAAYNPETGTTARKATGSFYTPREIVDYMVDESLVAYLEGQLTAKNAKNAENTKKRIRGLLAYDAEMPEFSGGETESLIDAIDHLKALDPAVGSGAFPMGILHKLVLVLGKLDPDNERWKAKQIAKLDDSTMREDAERLFRENYDDYGRKLYLIENCIYGVDIQPIAVQIAKMRFFISLIVDQKVNPKAPNLGVRALPNLETKFVAANTLIGIDRPAQMMLRNPDIDKKEDELRQVRQKHFTARTLKSKAKCREDDKRLRAEIAELLKNDGWDNTTAKQLASWDPYDQNAHAEFFDPEWMFGVMDGFDVVIGNPPYVQLQSNSGALARLYAGYNFETFDQSGDIYCLFYERGIELLRVNGHLSYITSKTWMRNAFAEPLRKYFAEKTCPDILVDFQGIQLFCSVVVNTNIILMRRLQPGKENDEACRACVVHDDTGGMSFVDYVRTNAITTSFMTSKPWIVLSEGEQRIKSKIERIGKPLRELGVSISRGILTGLNKAFIIDSETKQDLIGRNKESAELFKPILRGRDIKRYCCTFADQWLINMHNGTERLSPVDINCYPAIKRWLDGFEPKLSERCDQGKTPYNLRDCAYLDEMAKEKIVWGEISDKPKFSYDKEGYFVEATSFMMTAPCTKFLVAILNSRIAEYLFANIGTKTGMGTIRWKKYTIEQLSVPDVSPEKQAPLVEFVDRILAAKAADPAADTSALEREIDERVYQLYGLTAEEIAIVEGATQGKGCGK